MNFDEIFFGEVQCATALFNGLVTNCRAVLSVPAGFALYVLCCRNPVESLQLYFYSSVFTLLNYLACKLAVL